MRAARFLLQPGVSAEKAPPIFWQWEMPRRRGPGALKRRSHAACLQDRAPGLCADLHSRRVFDRLPRLRAPPWAMRWRSRNGEGSSFADRLRHAGFNVQRVWLGGQAMLGQHLLPRTARLFADAGASTRSRDFSPAEVTSTAGARSHRPRHWLRSQIARPPEQGEAARTKRAFQFGTKFVRAARDTRNVIADVGYDRRTRLEGKHSIERRHAINFRGGNVQAQRDIVECAGADPADAILDGMEHGQKAMPLA